MLTLGAPNSDKRRVKVSNLGRCLDLGGQNIRKVRVYCEELKVAGVATCLSSIVQQLIQTMGHGMTSIFDTNKMPLMLLLFFIFSQYRIR